MQESVSATYFAGLDCRQVRIMGIVNVTSDSFYEGSRTADTAAAVARGVRMLEEGADIIDVGGESTRPGAVPIAEDEETARVVPVVDALRREGALVSVDTRNGSVMRAALDAGARIVNDITAFSKDPSALKLVAERNAAVVLMHMQGNPLDMQKAPQYANAPREVRDWLAGRFAAARAAGIDADNIAVDPGIGFGKTAQHNLQILEHLSLYRDVGCALLIGASRKSFIAKVSAGEQASERLPGSLAAALAAVARGTHILRVHDVAETHQALAVWNAIAQRALEV